MQQRGAMEGRRGIRPGLQEGGAEGAVPREGTGALCARGEARENAAGCGGGTRPGRDAAEEGTGWNGEHRMGDTGKRWGQVLWGLGRPQTDGGECDALAWETRNPPRRTDVWTRQKARQQADPPDRKPRRRAGWGERNRIAAGGAEHGSAERTGSRSAAFPARGGQR